MDVWYKVLNEDCIKWLDNHSEENIHLTFIDPPFRQGKDYRFFDDNQPEEKYWNWLEDVLSKVYRITVKGGAVYFMQREKNTENGCNFERRYFYLVRTHAGKDDVVKIFVVDGSFFSPKRPSYLSNVFEYFQYKF